jgi:cullin-associated NEDD8-dissociated protein 1
MPLDFEHFARLFHESILQVCLKQLNSTSHLIRKRAGKAIGCLSAVLSDALVLRMTESLLSQIEVATCNKDDTRALIRTMCTICSFIGHRLGQVQIDRILSIFLSFCHPEDARTGDDDEDDHDHMEEDNQAAQKYLNEVRESCFNGLESFILKCPSEIQSHLQRIIQVSLAFMKYDPNYAYGDDEEVGDEDFEVDEEDEDEIEEGEDDEDDDDSWKVRRAAIRTIVAVVESQKHNPSMLWNTMIPVRKGKSEIVAGALIARFKEREENCRIDVIDCFTKLLHVTVSASSSGVISMVNDSGNSESIVAIDFRGKHAANVVKASEKILSDKGNNRSKTAVLSLLSTLCRVPGGIGGEDEVLSIFGHVKALLSGDGGRLGSSHATGVNKSLKLEALILVRVMLSSGQQDPQHLRIGLLKHIFDDLCAAVKEQWYKVIAEALRVLGEIPKVFISLLPSSEDEAKQKVENRKIALALYNAIEPLLAASDVDQEIKECSLVGCANLLTSLHSSLSLEHVNRLLMLLLEKLRNETTRMSAIKTLSAIALTSKKNVSGEDTLSLSPILSEVISTLATFLKQQNRGLKQSSLEALDLIIASQVRWDSKLRESTLFSSMLGDLSGLILDSDLHLSHLSLRVCISTLRVSVDCGEAVKEHVLPRALVLSTSPLLQEPALESLMNLLEQFVVSDVIDFTELFDLLNGRSNDESLGKQSIVNLSKCIAGIVSATAPNRRSSVINSMLMQIEDKDNVNARQIVINLLVSGDVGRVSDLGLNPERANQLKNIYLLSFHSQSDEIRHAAAYGLGRVAVGSPTIFLPPLVHALESSDSKTRYLLLVALREFIQCHLKENQKSLSQSIPLILPSLLNHTADSEESDRAMVATCLGALTCVEPLLMLQTLHKLISDHSAIQSTAGHVDEGDDVSRKNALICSTVLTSIKHAISGKISVADLSPYMPQFLEFVKHEEISVKYASLLMLYTAVHHSPLLVASNIKDSIMPDLYNVFDLKLTRTVDLGPFKHKVDDALPMRKSAMSIFALCLEKLPGCLDVASFMPILDKSLTDVEDIQLQAHHIIALVADKYPNVVVGAIDQFIISFENTFTEKNYKNKVSSKTGTELERGKEWIKSCLRAVFAVSKIEGSMTHRRFAILIEKLKEDPKFRPLLDVIEEEK